MMEELYLCVHVPEFAAQALLRLRPEMKARAVAVVAGTAPLERVCSVNRRAAVMGVCAGMTKAELDSFDGLVVLRRSAEEERAAKAVVMEVAGAFTPRVEDCTTGAHATDGACVVVLDGSGMERLFGPVERLARRLVRTLRELGLMARVGVSGNLLTAVVMARAMAVAPRDGAVRVVERGKEAAELAVLPISVLQPTEAQAETFVAWGVRTLGEVAALDEVELVVRMGQEGARLWRMAKGCAEHLMVPVEAGLRLEEVVEFDAPVDGMESLMFVLGPMLDQLIARAANRAMALASVRLEMGLDAHGGGDDGDSGSGCGGEHVRSIKPSLPVADRVLLLKLLHLDMEEHPPSAGVVRLRVTAEAGERSRVQTGLFRPQMPEAGRLEVTLARLAGLVGEGRVGRARLKDSHAPESFAMERFLLPAVAEERRSGRGRAMQDRVEWQMRELEQRRAAREEEQAQERGAFASPRRTATTATANATTDAEDPKGTQRGAVEEGCEGRSNVLSITQLRADAGARGAGTEVQEGGWGGVTLGHADEADARRCAVAIRRMRPAVPIRWSGNEESAFWMQGVLYEVRERFGPWRRSGAWWTGEVWSQEEWDIAVEAGGGVHILCVLAHNLLRDRWHMEAVYD